MVESYQNPILRGMYPDPSIVLVKDTYFVTIFSLLIVGNL